MQNVHQSLSLSLYFVVMKHTLSAAFALLVIVHVRSVRAQINRCHSSITVLDSSFIFGPSCPQVMGINAADSDRQLRSNQLGWEVKKCELCFCEFQDGDLILFGTVFSSQTVRPRQTITKKIDGTLFVTGGSYFCCWLVSRSLDGFREILKCSKFFLLLMETAIA